MESVDDVSDELRQDGDAVVAAEEGDGETGSIATYAETTVDHALSRGKTKDLKSNDQILNKSKMMNRLLEEIQVSERQRLEMQRQIVTLTQKLEESTVLMDKTNTDYIHIKRSLRDSETLIESLEKEKDSLLVRLNDLVQQNQLRIANDDEIIAAVNQRVEEWKAVFLSKETTILQLQNEIMKLKESLAASNSTQTTTTIAVLSKAIREKDAKIDKLTSELQQATKELEQSAVVIENLNAAQNSSKDSDWQKKQIHSLQRKLCGASEREEELRVRLSDAETSAVESERALAEALAQLRAYECSEYGLVDAVQEIKDCRLQLQLRDRQIEDLTLTVDQMEMAVLNLKEESDVLKAKLGLEVHKQDLEDILKGFTKASQHVEKPRNLSRLIKSRIYDSDLMSLENKPEKRVLQTGQLHDNNTQSNVFLNEITQQVKLLHSEFRDLIQTTKNFKHSSDVVDKVDDNKVKDRHKLDALNSMGVEDAVEPVKLVRSENVESKVAETETVKYHTKEAQPQNNLQNVTKLEKELNEACKTIEDLEQKLLDKEKQNIKDSDNETKNTKEYPYITKLDSYLSYYLKNFVDVDYKITEEKQESEDLPISKLEYESVLEDYKALVKTLEKPDSNSLKCELAEMSRRYTMSKVNERKLARKCAYLMESESLQRKKNLKLHNDILSLSNASLRRIHYLEGFKHLSSFKIAALHRALEGTVLSTEMNGMQRHVDELLDRQSSLMQHNQQLLNLINTNSQSVSVMNVADLHRMPKVDQTDLFPSCDLDEIRTELENSRTENAVLLNEICQLKVINEVAENQVKSLETLHLSKCLELENVRSQLLDTLSNEDERELIRKLYLQILHLQLSESNLQNKLESCQTQIQKIEVFSLRLEQICDDKDQLLHRHSWQSRNKINRLRNMTRQLMREASEKRGELSMAALKLKEDQFRVDQMLKNAKEEKQQVNALKVELETRNEAVDTLLRSMKNESGLRELMEKYDKITDLRVQSKKQQCELEWVSEDLEQSRVAVTKQERRIAFLESQLTRLTSEQWQHEMALEKKDSELEKTLMSSDKVLIVEKDLNHDQRIRQMKDDSILLSEKQDQIKQLTKREKEAVKKVEELEILVSARDQVIMELTSQQPSGVEVRPKEHGGGTDGERSMSDVAQAVLDTLKARLKQKEETIQRYHEIMENAKKEMMTMVDNHKKELNKNQLDDRSIIVDKSRKLVDAVKPFSDSFQQISRMNELQEMTVQQDNAIVILADKLKASSKDIQKWQLKVDVLTKEFNQEKEKIVVEYEALIRKLENELDQSKLSLKKLSEELETMRERLEEQIEANENSPSTQMKKLIDDLKSQLRNKDREAQSLSRTVVSLNNKMKTMAMDSACLPQNNTQINCQRCPTLNKELESAKVEVAFLRRKLKNQEGLLQHLKEVEDKLDKQVTLCTRLKNENSRFQQTIQSLESKVKNLSIRVADNVGMREKKRAQLDETSQESLNQQRWSHVQIVEKLNLELIEMAKQNALLRKNLEKSRTTNQVSKRMEATGQSKSSAQPQVPYDEHSINEGLNLKIKALMDEIDQLTFNVKEALSTSQTNEMFNDEMQSLINREAQLRHEVMKLQSDNMELMTEIEQLKTEQCRSKRSSHTKELEKSLGKSSTDSEVWKEADKLIREKDSTIEILQKEILKWQKDKLDASSLLGGDAVISKIVEHNERLLQDFHREVKTNERHRIQLYTMKVENEKLQRQIDEYRNKINKRDKR